MQKLRDLAIAFSLANLCFFGPWSELLPGQPNQYLMWMAPSPFAFAALILNVSLFALLFWGAMTFARHSRQVHVLTLARWMFLAVFIIAVNGLRQKVPALTYDKLLSLLGEAGLKGVGVIIGATAVPVLVRWHRGVIHATATIILVLFPFVLVTFSRVGWSLMNYQSAFAEFADKPPAPLLTVRSKQDPRVLWLVFDEMDQRLTFPERPSTVSLPEIDRFLSDAFYARNAYPPARNTLSSMPALITGKVVSKAQQIRANELSITFAGAETPVNWSTQPNIFSRARDLGFHTGAVGCYHPYCRVIGDSLTKCAFYWWNVMPKLTMSENLSDQLVKFISIVPLGRQLRLEERFKRLVQPESVDQGVTREVRRYLRIFEDAKKAATDADLGLTLVHWPIPHPPGIYDRTKKDFAWEGGRSYLDNLELVDLTLGELRRAMEAAGVWETTTVLITSDHSYRTNLWKPQGTSVDGRAIGGKIDLRVPFLIKLAGQKKSVAYDLPLNTILTHDMIIALFRGEISGPESLAAWVDQQRSIVPRADGPID